MRVIIQRISTANVEVKGKVVASIGNGVLVFTGFEEDDKIEDLQWVSNKIIALRIFQDNDGKMNLSLHDVKGEILVVSQFSLHALIKKGNRPSFIKACKYDKAEELYNDFVSIMERDFKQLVKSGVFGADMKVNLLNDGPLTFFIDTKNKE